MLNTVVAISIYLHSIHSNDQSLQQGISSALHGGIFGEGGVKVCIQWENSVTGEAEDSQNRGSKKDQKAGYILKISDIEICTV